MMWSPSLACGMKFSACKSHLVSFWIRALSQNLGNCLLFSLCAGSPLAGARVDSSAMASGCTIPGFALTDESIAGSMYGEEVLRLLGIRFEFLAQTHQVRVDGTGSWKVVVSPNVFEKTIAAERFTGVRDEVLEQLKFLR